MGQGSRRHHRKEAGGRHSDTGGIRSRQNREGRRCEGSKYRNDALWMCLPLQQLTGGVRERNRLSAAAESHTGNPSVIAPLPSCTDSPCCSGHPCVPGPPTEGLVVPPYQWSCMYGWSLKVKGRYSWIPSIKGLVILYLMLHISQHF